MQKKTLALLLAFAAITVLQGCSRGQQPGFSRSGKILVRYSTWDGGITLQMFNQVARDFNASQNEIEVQILSIPSDYDSRIIAMIAAGSTPEIAAMESSTILYPLADEGRIANLLDFFRNDTNFDSSNFIDSLAFWVNHDFLAGYGIGPQNIGLFYNTEMFARHGIPEPPGKYADAWDWDTFVNAARHLTIDRNGNNALSNDFDRNNIMTYGVTFGKWFGMYYSIYNTTGGSVLSPDGNQLGLFTPQGIDAMQKLADLIHVYNVSPTPIANAGLSGQAENFLTGRVAMTIDGHWNNANLIEGGVSYNVAALPKINSPATLAVAGALSIMETPRKEAAWEFFKFLFAPGTTRPLEENGLWLPATREGLSENYLRTVIGPNHPSNYFDTFVAPMLDGTAGRIVPGWLVNFNRINNEFDAMLDPLWTGDRTYQDLVNENSARINAMLGGERIADRL